MQAQQGWEAGGWLGVSHYFGDINSSFNLQSPGFAGGVNARYNFNNRLCFKFSANYLNVSADDKDSKNTFEQNRNLHFKSAIFDGTGQLEFNFLPYDHGSSLNFFTPYLFLGGSVFHFNPKAEYNGETYELRNFGTEGQFRGEEYYSIQGAVAYGVGLKLDLSYEWSINVELSARKLFTDYLDDVSTVYPDLDDLEALRGEIAVALSNRSPKPADIHVEGRQRGNSKNKDNYAFIGVSLMYYFGDLRCPKYSR
ncbi:MAG TPA: hypothetical protein ENJ45_03285 [Phaeodactylibacter sp.]|nr:hypothetical protein [Phaeodactylibacter sp.]